MGAATYGPHELERLLEHQMRVQERQLAWARLGMVVLAAILLVAVAPDLEGLGILLGILTSGVADAFDCEVAGPDAMIAGARHLLRRGYS